MADWVLKGSLKGPQGDPGQDAQLPAGGTEGQVLTKTSGGEAWADVPQPDMTGVVKIGESMALESDGSPVGGFFISSDPLMSKYFLADVTSSAASIGVIGGANGSISIAVSDDGPEFSIIGGGTGGSAKSITSDVSTGDTYALATAKAVKDYVDAQTIDTPVPISQGGTGATTADGARTALGISVADPDELVEYIKGKLGA